MGRTMFEHVQQNLNNGHFFAAGPTSDSAKNLLSIMDRFSRTDEGNQQMRKCQMVRIT